MIGRDLLDAVLDPAAVTDQMAEHAENIILAFAVKDLPTLRERMEHMVGLRLYDALRDPQTSASHINAAMRWLEQTNPDRQGRPEEDPVAAAIRRARPALAAGGKLPEDDPEA